MINGNARVSFFTCLPREDNDGRNIEDLVEAFGEAMKGLVDDQPSANLTTVNGFGRWKDETGKVFSEPVTVFEVSVYASEMGWVKELIKRELATYKAAAKQKSVVLQTMVGGSGDLIFGKAEELLEKHGGCTECFNDPKNNAFSFPSPEFF